MGSGGGGADNEHSWGGGAVFINASSLEIEGKILADGGNGKNKITTPYPFFKKIPTNLPPPPTPHPRPPSSPFFFLSQLIVKEVLLGIKMRVVVDLADQFG